MFINIRFVLTETHNTNTIRRRQTEPADTPLVLIARQYSISTNIIITISFYIALTPIYFEITVPKFSKKKKINYARKYIEVTGT